MLAYRKRHPATPPAVAVDTHPAGCGQPLANDHRSPAAASLSHWTLHRRNGTKNSPPRLITWRRMRLATCGPASWDVLVRPSARFLKAGLGVANWKSCARRPAVS